MAESAPELRIRQASRAVIVDDDERVLLVRFEFPDSGTHWAVPGGGLEPSESHDEALRRELREEVGRDDLIVGPEVWTRLHIIPFFGGLFDGQHEVYHLVRTAAFEPNPGIGWDRMNAECVFDLRWWTVDEIVSSDERFVPAALGAGIVRLLTEVRDGGTPSPVYDIGV